MWDSVKATRQAHNLKTENASGGSNPPPATINPY